MSRNELRNRYPRFSCGATSPAHQSGRIDGAALALAALLVALTLVGLSIGWGAL